MLSETTVLPKYVENTGVHEEVLIHKYRVHDEAKSQTSEMEIWRNVKDDTGAAQQGGHAPSHFFEI